LTNTLRLILKFDSSSLLPALYLLSNSLSPAYSPIELGLGSSTLNKAILHVSGLTPAALKRLWHSSGDPGDVAFDAKSNVRTLVPHPPLLIVGVYESMLKIASAKGHGAAKQKQSIVERLLVSAKGEEVRFLARTLSMNLRVGAVRTTLLTALARAMVLTPPSDLVVPIAADSSFSCVNDLLRRISLFPENVKKGKKAADPDRAELQKLYVLAEGLMKKTYVQHPNYADIVDALRSAGLDGLAANVTLTVGKLRSEATCSHSHDTFQAFHCIQRLVPQ
jgi:DNA ligase 1